LDLNDDGFKMVEEWVDLNDDGFKKVSFIYFFLLLQLNVFTIYLKF